MQIVPSQLEAVIAQTLASVPITDIHTHLFPEQFGSLALYGVDEILTYHYLVAEFFRYSSLEHSEFFQLPKSKQADLIWQKLFLERSPVSESQRGVLTIFNRLGLNVQSRSLDEYRAYYSSRTMSEQMDAVFKLAGVKEVVMTNDPFDPRERGLWNDGMGKDDPRFKAAMRIDPLLLNYASTYKVLQAEGYQVSSDLDPTSVAEVRRFLADWAKKMDALYLAVSLPHNFTVRDNSLRTRLLKKCVLPVCAELGLPLAAMIGVKRSVNPGLDLAGDSLGKAEISVIEELCTEHPQNKFMVTMLSRENQHELAITARKYRNLMVFGCWWFLNNPSIIREITQMRLETLGLSFIPQHSDARVLEHLIYKWEHSKAIISEVLVEKYADLLKTGWTLTKEAVMQDVRALLRDNFYNFLTR